MFGGVGLMVVGLLGLSGIVLGFSRFGIAIEGAAGGQRFAFQARAPIKILCAAMGRRAGVHNADWPRKYLVLWYGGLEEGSNRQPLRNGQEHRERHVTAQQVGAYERKGGTGDGRHRTASNTRGPG